jgi:hypothetical protein
MKPFVMWLGIALASFAGLGGGYHLYLSENPHKLLVVVDASFAMQSDWSRVARNLSELQHRRYTTFSLFTEKGKVHGWSQRLHPGKISPYAPRDFSKLLGGASYAEMDEANERILITNAPSGELDAFDDWVIKRPSP